MKNLIIGTLAALTIGFGTTAVSSAQSAQFIYNDGAGTPNAGTFAPGQTFTFSINLAFTPGGSVTNLDGLSYWFQAADPNPPFTFAITLRDITGSSFNNLQTPGLTYPQILGPQNTSDLGGLLDIAQAPLGAGTYFVANVSFSIDAATAPGTYVIQNVTNGGRAAVVTDSLGHTSPISQGFYTITVVPEPATLSLAVSGFLGIGLLVMRRRRHSRA